MAQFKYGPKVSFEVYIGLTESEARALAALTLYGTDGFLEMFYKHMGRSYLQPNEDGLRSLFDSIKKNIPPQLSKIDKARNIFSEMDES